MGDAEWTIALGWRKAIIRIAVCGAASMGISFGGCALVVWLFGKLDQLGGGGLGYVPWPIWGATAAVAGLIGGLLISLKLVERSGLAGAPVLFTAAAALILAHFAAYWLGMAFCGPRWHEVFAYVCSVACVVAVAMAAWRILVDS